MNTKYLVAEGGMYEALAGSHGDSFPGIYRLHVLDEHGEFLHLPRLLDTDPQGTLYIGTSGQVLTRLGNLRKSISAAYWKVDPATYGTLEYRDPSPHQTGQKIVQMPRFVSRFPFERLCVTVEPYTGAEKDVELVRRGHTELETRLLLEYKESYGEYPALNS